MARWARRAAASRWCPWMVMTLCSACRMGRRCGRRCRRLLLRWRRGMWRWLLVRMRFLPGLGLSWRVMMLWLLLVALRARRMVWLRMLWRLVMLLGALRSRRMRLTLVRLLLPWMPLRLTTPAST